MFVAARPRLLALLTVAPLALMPASSALAQPEGGGPPPPSPVGIVTVQPKPVPITSQLPGRIAPTRIAEVLPRVSGILVEQVFQQGSIVKEGDVLYRIDPAPFQVEVDRARAQLQQAEAARLLASQQFGRAAQLNTRGFASGQQRDDTQATLAQAEAGVAVAKASLAAAELNLRYASISAPIGGRIGRALITQGALVSPTSGTLATIQQLDPIYADFTQSANQLIQLRRGLREGKIAATGPEQAEVRLFLDDGTAYKHPGTLLFSEATVDPTTGQVTLRGQFPNPEGELLPGMYVRVEINQGVQPNALTVPQQSLQRDAAGNGQVYVVKDDDTVELRPVTTDRIAAGEWVITQGLNPGERVVVDGFQRLGPGAKVATAPWAPSPANPAAPTAPSASQ